MLYVVIRSFLGQCFTEYGFNYIDCSTLDIYTVKKTRYTRLVVVCVMDAGIIQVMHWNHIEPDVIQVDNQSKRGHSERLVNSLIES